MIHLGNDYSTGAHPRVLEALVASNEVPASGYGTDPWMVRVRDRVREIFEAPEAEVVALAGGTQVNLVAVDLLLDPWEGVVSADTGHVAVHEAGAIEHTGHKVITLPSRGGKFDIGELRRLLAAHAEDPAREHMVAPALVYVTFPTELGTLWTREELAELRSVADEAGVRIFLDGARLSHGLASPAGDVRPADVAAAADAFTIGGTKIGALCGELLVFPRGGLPAHMPARVKQKGALLAKGRLLSVQFDALLTDGLHLEIGAHACRAAARMGRALVSAGVELLEPVESNQVFALLPEDVADALAEHVAFTRWEPAAEGRVPVRFAASWSTTDEDLAGFEDALGRVVHDREGER